MGAEAALNGLERNEILGRLSSTEMDDSLHRRFMLYVDQGGVSQSVIAKKIGRSTAAVSQYMNRKFVGNLAEMERDIAAMLRREEDLEFVSGPAVFIATEPSKLMWEVLQFCDTKQKMGAVLAPSGTGKTETCKEYKRKNRNSVMVTADITTRSPAAILRLIGAHIGITKSLSIPDLLHKVIDRLRESNRLVIVDEAHFLRWEACEILRKIHDCARVGVVYVGQERLYEQMKGGDPRSYLFDQIYSRIAIKRDRFTVNKKDAAAIAGTVVRGLDKDCLDYLYQRARGKGRFRYLTNLLDVATEICKQYGKQIDVPLLHEAERFLVGE